MYPLSMQICKNKHYQVRYIHMLFLVLGDVFENPIEAFQNINTALKTDGRLSFVCWQSPQKNLWQTLVMKK